MAEILVLGAGLTGLTTAMLLARDGHDVTVLERDAAEPPPTARRRAWTGWDRAGVAQFHQLHLHAAALAGGDGGRAAGRARRAAGGRRP